MQAHRLSLHDVRAEAGRREHVKILYVAGPYRGRDAWEVEQNIRRAETVALELWRMGAAVICPHANSRYFSGALPDDTFLRGDLAMLERCDGVVALPDWLDSEGARLEVEHASALGKHVFVWRPGNWALVQWIAGEGATLDAGGVSCPT